MNSAYPPDPMDLSRDAKVDAQLARHDKTEDDYEREAGKLVRQCIAEYKLSKMEGMNRIASLLEARDQVEFYKTETMKIIMALGDELKDRTLLENVLFLKQDRDEARGQLEEMQVKLGKEHQAFTDSERVRKSVEEVWHGAEAELTQCREERDQLRSQLTALQERLAQLSQPEKQIKDWVFNANELQKDNNKLREQLTALRQSSGALYNWIQGNVTIDERTRDVMNRLYEELDKGVKEDKR